MRLAHSVDTISFSVWFLCGQRRFFDGYLHQNNWAKITSPKEALIPSRPSFFK